MAIGSKVVTWIDGNWHEGNHPIIGSADHAVWLGSLVFDGARQFEGTRPDLDLHCDRLIASAETMGLLPPVDARTIQGLIEEGCRRFDDSEALYLRPMMWATRGGPGVIEPDPEDTGFAICIENYPMPEIGRFSLTISPYRRPRQDMALTAAKAASLYANNGRIVADARRRGFSNALSLDVDGYVAETASTNVFMVRDGEILTPVPNGMFLAGLTRRRVIGLLAAEGERVNETKLTVDDFRSADEIFVTGNIGKVVPVTRFEDRELGMGPISLGIRDMYWDFAHSAPDSGQARQDAAA